MARLLALFGAVVISFSAILIRIAGVSPSTAAVFRPLYALPFLACVVLMAPAPARTPSRRVAAAAAGGLMGLAFTIWHLAIEAIGAGLSTVLSNTQVVFVGLAAWGPLGERPSRGAAVAVPAAFLGAVLTSGLGGAGAYGDAPVRGVALGLANGLVYAAFLMMFRSLATGQRVAAGPLADATAGAAVVALAIGVLIDPGLSLRPTWPAHGWLVLAGLGPQTVGWLCILYALPRLPALETSVTLLLQPVLTVAWAGLLLAEAPSAVQLAGVGLVLAGVVLLSILGSARRPRGEPVGRPS